MAIKQIQIVPDPVLRKIAEPLETITDETKQLLDDMAQTMYDAPGIGLAGPQIGELKRLMVVDCSRDDEANELWQMVNPEITQFSEETSLLEEGCWCHCGTLQWVDRQPGLC